MSVLIKGMKIPKTCTMCWFSPICPVWVKEVSRHKGYDNRLPNCPLVEVPPHGRLIAADKLERDIEQYHLSDGKFQHWVQVQNTIIEAEEGADHD